MTDKTKLKQWAEREKITRKRLSVAFNKTPRHITGYLSGSRFPSKGVLLALKGISGLSWDDLMSTWFSEEDVTAAVRSLRKNIPAPEPYHATPKSRLELKCMKIKMEGMRIRRDALRPNPWDKV